MTGRLLQLIWLSAQAAVACWFLLSTAVDRQFLFFFVLALSFPAGAVGYWQWFVFIPGHVLRRV